MTAIFVEICLNFYYVCKKWIYIKFAWHVWGNINNAFFLNAFVSLFFSTIHSENLMKLHFYNYNKSLKFFYNFDKYWRFSFFLSKDHMSPALRKSNDFRKKTSRVVKLKKKFNLCCLIIYNTIKWKKNVLTNYRETALDLLKKENIRKCWKLFELACRPSWKMMFWGKRFEISRQKNWMSIFFHLRIFPTFLN